MVEYSETEQQIIRSIFSDFKDAGVDFVIPRNYQQLPERVDGGDIDIVIRPDDLGAAVEISERYGFERRSTAVSRIKGLARRVLEYPQETIRLIRSDPTIVYSSIKDALLPDRDDFDELAAEYSEKKREQGNVIFHFMNHLAYKSPKNGRKVRVNPLVEDLLYKRSEYVEGVPIPAPPDELAHLVCRGVFKYEGKFPDYYINQCDKLKQDVLSNPESHQAFTQLLSLLFFEADDTVLSHIEDSRYNQIKPALISFSGY
ncbi:hypothetical protein ACFQJ7_12130 [Halovenus rubra]|uniref:Nucleotidyltransferase n=2 Tax=Halovenus rubra TaxID=869890 RepID=A0ABD5XA22_9EURY|nr:hypothetical protein [Halovenus rubra]